MMLLVAWISGVLATIHYLSWITIFFTPVWLGVLGILISEDRLSGFVRGYVVGMLLILGTMIVGGVVVGLLGHFGEW